MDVIDKDGKIILYSLKKFQEDIVQGENCFICGSSASQKEFNDEHVIPKWILRKFNLFEKSIRLPNHTPFKYGSYHIPCCVKCNGDLNERFEKKISKLMNNDYSSLCQILSSDLNVRKLVIHWLVLISFKTHLKDTTLKMHRDKRMGDGQIGDMHFWDHLHYLHCFARSFHTNLTPDPSVFGSFIMLPRLAMDDGFDYCDAGNGSGVMIGINNVCLIYISKDCGVSLECFSNSDIPDRILSPLNRIQLREIFIRLLEVYALLKSPPNFEVRKNSKGQLKLLSIRKEEIQFNDPNPELFRTIAYSVFADDIKNNNISEQDFDQFCLRKASFIV